MKADISQGFHIFLDGNAWCAVGPNFRDLQQDRTGFGRTPSDAYEAWWQANCRWLTQSGHTNPDYAKFVIHELDTAPEATRECKFRTKVAFAILGNTDWRPNSFSNVQVAFSIADTLIGENLCAPSVPVPSAVEMREILGAECKKIGFGYASVVMANPEKYGESHWCNVALAAMRELASRMGGKS